jgi:hypothetical protein
LEKIGQQNEAIMKYKRRLFIAKKPFNPRKNFIEQAQSEVFRCFRCVSSGLNITQTKFERNFFLSDEEVNIKCKIDNERSNAKCSSVVIKLIRTIKAQGRAIAPNSANGIGPLLSWDDNIVVASRYFSGVPPHYKDKDFSREISLFLDAVDQNFISKRKNKGKNWSPEDIAFANGL